MGKLTRIATSAAAVMLTISSAATGIAVADPPKLDHAVTVALSPARLRNCDHTLRGGGSNFGPNGNGQGQVVFRRNGNTVTAELHWVDTKELGMHYSVGLIQVPRPASAPCGPGSPGTAYTELVIPDTGVADITLESPIQQGTTGVWLKMDRPGPHSQEPAEYYTSDYVVHL